MAKTSVRKTPKPVFFTDAAALRAWLTTHHARAKELYIGFYKVKTKRRGISYTEAVEEALCFGWIDGRVNRIDDTRHMQRYTPRVAGSHWSRINIARCRALQKAGRMTPAGLAAFKARDERRTINYSYELRAAAFPPVLLARFKANAAAWRFFQAQPASYRRLMAFRVTSAKRPETQARRFERVYAASSVGKRLNLLTGEPE